MIATSRLGWYARRAGMMSPAEMVWRVRVQMVRAAWSLRRVTRKKLVQVAAGAPARELTFTAVLPPGTALRVPAEARTKVLEAADGLLRGEWETLGVLRTDLERPDWFRDPVTGRRSDPDRYAFRVDHRSEERVGNVKQVWELSRLQHLTLLATAWFLSRDERYARRVSDHLRSWWRENPFLSGVHWTSGIELGIRLISLAWIRRLLADWPDVADLFEHNALAVRQIRWHQQYLGAFPSRGSSANNHVIAEAAGQLVASCAFPWFRQSPAVAAKVRVPAGTRAPPQLVSVRCRPRARFGLSVLHRRTRVRRGRRGRNERSSTESVRLGPAVRDGGQRGGPGRCAPAPASPG